MRVIEQAIERTNHKLKLKVLTRFDTEDFWHHASDLLSITKLVNRRENIEVRFSSSIHAKVFLGRSRMIIGSANLTSRALFGQNDELSFNTSDPVIIAELRQKIVNLWDTSEGNVTLLMCENEKRKLANLERKIRGVQNKIDNVFHKSRCGLQGFPAKDSSTGNYYEAMLDCLQVVANHNNGLTREDFLNYMKENARNKESESLPLRIDFLRELQLIRILDENVMLTSHGKRLLRNVRSNRKWFFSKLLFWCEARRDYQFRVLLKAVPRIQPSPFGLAEWRSKLRAYPEGSPTRWWHHPMQGSFNSNTDCARGWLKALGVLTPESGNLLYRKGNLFPANGKSEKTVCAWLDEMIEINNE